MEIPMPQASEVVLYAERDMKHQAVQTDVLKSFRDRHKKNDLSSPCATPKAASTRILVGNGFFDLKLRPWRENANCSFC